MKNSRKMTGMAAVVVLFGVIVTGCAGTTGTTEKSFEENFRFVPSVHVEDNTFGVISGTKYTNCSYDDRYNGYWCPK